MSGRLFSDRDYEVLGYDSTGLASPQVRSLLNLFGGRSSRVRGPAKESKYLTWTGKRRAKPGKGPRSRMERCKALRFKIFL